MPDGLNAVGRDISCIPFFAGMPAFSARNPDRLHSTLFASSAAAA
ncbi:hypothetical protein ASZ90_009003 [hydrocarbon metagenome]|uniref:Uncharacterized protein n=1 Tax=hydrocarbon metagenome TaxID=938273 RepID=A0A0W8FK09_9ZZZZ